MDTTERLANRHFLVVDDEDFVRSLIVRLLTQSGAAGVVEAADGQQAIEAINGYDLTFDAVISDINMRPMNGLELLCAIRIGAGGLKRNLPVLMLTANSQTEYVSEALALDANAFVLKPVSREALVDRLLRVFERGVTIQPADAYGAVPVEKHVPVPLAPAPPTKPLVVAVGGAPKASAAPPPARTQPGQRGSSAPDSREQRVPVSAVKPNSVLTQDVYIGDPPRLLLAAPAILTQATLDRLEDLRLVHASYTHLFVVESTR